MIDDEYLKTAHEELRRDYRSSVDNWAKVRFYLMILFGAGFTITACLLALCMGW